MVFGIVGLLFILVVLGLLYALSKIFAQSDTIAAAKWAARFPKEPPEEMYIKWRD